MSDDDTFNKLAATAGVTAVAGLSTVAPPAAMLLAAGAFVVTNYNALAVHRAGALEIVHDSLFDTMEKDRSEQQKRYEDSKDDFERHDAMFEWVKKELEKVLGRVATLESLALNIMASSEELLRAQPDPEMRPYFVSAYRNAITKSDTFNPYWVKKLVPLLANLGPCHIGLLRKIYKLARTRMEAPDADGGRHLEHKQFMPAPTPDELLAISDMKDAGLLLRRETHQPPYHKTFALTFTGCRIVELTYG